MKKWLIPMMIIAFFIAFYNQNNPHPNVLITVFAVVVFMFGMMKLSAKTPSKNQDEEIEEDEQV